ncbi:MAG: capsule assembly Wzi family protein [candidate division KSB1 bacterium]|nr:capsule assembly Wzi family protein [candidate division KSB1 bacterium]
MTVLELWQNYFGNKFAFNFGFLWTDPLGIENLNLKAEYTRIDPFVYAHKDSINIYTHYDKIIGHPLGPDSDSAYLGMQSYLHRDFSVSTFYEKIRQADGYPDTHSRPEQGEEKNFLDGRFETRHKIGVKIQNQIRRDIFVSASYTYIHINDANLKPGKTATDQTACFQLSFNY